MLEPNTLLQDRYLIEGKLGQGGMGAVYLAVDKRFDTKVALKETLVTNDDLRRAFEREARLLNKLRHAALPHVIDYFSQGAGEFLVMQFIPGDDFAKMLEKNGQPFPADQVVRWADQILAALEYLHAYDPPIVHRDIKPQNLKLTPQGEVILLDFGLSKGSAMDVSQAAGGASVAGFTPHFAPLEQIRGAGTNPRSDLYSLAATLYMMLTGQMPPDALERASAMLGGRPDPLVPIPSLNPQVPAAIGQVLTIALAQSPENRWASAKAMRGALAEAASKSGATQVFRAQHDTVVAPRPPATVPTANTNFPPPPSGQPSGPASGPSYGQPASGPPSGPSYVPGAIFNPPPQSAWSGNQGVASPQYFTPQPGTMAGMQGAVPSYAAPQQSGSRWVRWTLFFVWLTAGFVISLFAGAIFAVLFMGENPPPQLTMVLTLVFYLIGVVGLLVWCKW